MASKLNGLSPTFTESFVIVRHLLPMRSFVERGLHLTNTLTLEVTESAMIMMHEALDMDGMVPQHAV